MPTFDVLYDGELRQLDLEDGEHRVGRASDNAVQLPVASVSKNHAVLRVDGDRLFVKDLGSTNGTDVDGQPVGASEVEVAAEATVRFAGVALWRHKENPNTSPNLADDSEVSSHISYRPTQGFSDAARERIMGMLSSLFELLTSDENPREIAARACEFVSKYVPCDRVVLLEDDGEGTQISEKAHWLMRGDTSEKLRLSSTIVGQVLSQRESVLVANALNDPNYSGHESIMALDLRSAMAAPLFDNERVRGILYLDTADAGVSYAQEDLQVFTATANAVAVKLRNLSLESELKTAARIQLAMLPEKLAPPEGYEVEAHLVMCRSVGGDLYYCIERPDGKFLVVLGDVAGKGTPAALAMTAAIVLIRTLAEIGGELPEFVQRLHRQLHESLAPEQFITMFLGELDPSTGHMTFVNCGHPPPIVRHADGSLDELNSTGLPVAMIDRLPAEVAETTLQPGDTLAIFSDGIPEATKSGDEMLGDDALGEWLAAEGGRPLPEVVQYVVEEVDRFLEGEPNSDDLTLLLIRRN